MRQYFVVVRMLVLSTLIAISSTGIDVHAEEKIIADDEFDVCPLDLPLDLSTISSNAERRVVARCLEFAFAKRLSTDANRQPPTKRIDERWRNRDAEVHVSIQDGKLLIYRAPGSIEIDAKDIILILDSSGFFVGSRSRI